MDRPLRLLTLNHHESYLGLLAATGHHFDIITDYKGLDLSWSPDRTPVQANMQLVSFDAALRQRIKSGHYDYIVCHTLKNLIWFFPYLRCRFIFIEHIPLFFFRPSLAAKSFAKRCLLRLFHRTHRTTIVAVSPFKASTWQLPQAKVIEPTPQPMPLAKEQATYERILVVGNHLRERGEELGWPLLAELLKEFPIDVIGLNPGIASARRFKDFASFQSNLSHYRIYLYTIAQPYGDGYNLSLLEAMSMGMAVVSIANPSSPVIHQVNGLLATDASGLAAHLRYLLSHPREVERLGAAARQTVAERFGRERFLSAWNAVFAGN